LGTTPVTNQLTARPGIWTLILVIPWTKAA